MGRKSKIDLMANAIVYSYPCGSMDIICASDKIFIPAGYEDAEDYTRPGRQGAEPGKREKGKKSEGVDCMRSMRRARANLRRLALANNFRFFVTLTLDAAKIDRYDGAAITRALSRFCSNMVQRRGLFYILVPERHKDGAIHFHGFFGGDGVDVVDSGTIDMDGWKHPKRPCSEAQRAEWLAAGGRIVYNLPQWTFGFSTAVELYGDYSAAVGYVCKYIGKQEGERPLGRWYYSGGPLAKPQKMYTVLDYYGLASDYEADATEFSIPGSKLLVIHTKSEG